MKETTAPSSRRGRKTGQVLCCCRGAILVIFLALWGESGASKGLVDPTAGAALLRRAQQQFEEACFPAPRDWGGFLDADAREAFSDLVGLLLVLSGTEEARVGVIDAESGAGSPSFRLWRHRAKPLRCALQLAVNITGAARVDPLASGASAPLTLLLWEAPGVSFTEAKTVLDRVGGALAPRAAVVLLGTGVRGPASDGAGADGPASGAARALEEWAGVRLEDGCASPSSQAQAWHARSIEGFGGVLALFRDEDLASPLATLALYDASTFSPPPPPGPDAGPEAAPPQGTEGASAAGQETSAYSATPPLQGREGASASGRAPSAYEATPPPQGSEGVSASGPATSASSQGVSAEGFRGVEPASSSGPPRGPRGDGVGAISSCWGCEGGGGRAPGAKWDVPGVYITLQPGTKRDVRMQERVRNLRPTAEIKRFLGSDGGGDERCFSLEDLEDEVDARTVCTCISHWSAIAAALAAFPHAPYVVVLEDDASFELLPLWPGTLRAFLDTLSSQVPAWEMLNLAVSNRHALPKWRERTYFEEYKWRGAVWPPRPVHKGAVAYAVRRTTAVEETVRRMEVCTASVESVGAPECVRLLQWHADLSVYFAFTAVAATMPLVVINNTADVSSRTGQASDTAADTHMRLRDVFVRLWEHEALHDAWRASLARWRGGGGGGAN